MDSAWLVPVSLAFGVLVGAGLVSLCIFAARARRAGRARRQSGRARRRRPGHRGPGVRGRRPRPVEQRRQGLARRAGLRTGRQPGPRASGTGALVDRVRRDGEPITEEVELARGPFGDANIFLFVRVARLGARYVLLLAEDRTESYRLDAVRRDFVANISHELKTPIGAVSCSPRRCRRPPTNLTRCAGSRSGSPRSPSGWPGSRRRSSSCPGCRRRMRWPSRTSSTSTTSSPLAIDQNRVAADVRHITIVSGGDARRRGLRRRAAARRGACTT